MKPLIAALLLALSAPAAFAQNGAQNGPQSGQVWKSPSCGCCKSWVSHMAANGFALAVTEATPSQLDAVKAQSGVAQKYASCHTAMIAGYAIEGHVPASAVKRLLAEKPDAIGLSVPGMPEGSPGMETGGPPDAYDVLLMKKDGTVDVFEHIAAPSR